ncbi:hypothetical protein Zmor_002225 [Zophobas morio]|uniref:Uncharacterized protein n=1 Tax=Zophobas morio TaxID=2755281 RepID=A0AA38JAW7_9CUCU|nr:hypothetical protein Zmor_002225 [Zophobas morio]
MAQESPRHTKVMYAVAPLDFRNANGIIIPSHDCRENPFSFQTPFTTSHIFSFTSSVPSIHASLRTPSPPGAFPLFSLPICLSISSFVISEPLHISSVVVIPLFILQHFSS